MQLVYIDVSGQTIQATLDDGETLDVMPSLALDNGASGSEVNIILLAEPFEGHAALIPASQGDDLPLCESSLPASAATDWVVAPLHSPIDSIGSRITKKQMGRAHTGRVVTTVQDMRSTRDGAINQHPCYAVGFFIPMTLNAKDPISVLIMSGCPNPTSSRLVNLCPKTACQWRGLISLTAAFSRTEDAFATVPAWLTDKCLSAYLTDKTAHRR